MLMRCTCCGRWTVGDETLDGRTVLRIRFQDRPMKVCRTPLDVQQYLSREVYNSLLAEPEDGGCE